MEFNRRVLISIHFKKRQLKLDALLLTKKNLNLVSFRGHLILVINQEDLDHDVGQETPFPYK